MSELPVVKAFTGGEKEEPYGTSEIFDYKGDKIGEIAKHPDMKAKKDIDSNKASRSKMEEMSVEEVVDIIEEAGDRFLEEKIGAGNSSPEEYVEQVSRITGLPKFDVENSMKMIKKVLNDIEGSLKAQSPDGSLEVYDSHLYDVPGDNKVGWIPKGDNLGIVAPSNHPAVLSLAVIGYGTKYPVTIKPSDGEPFTSSRLVDALDKAGAPKGSVQMVPGNRKHGITEKVVSFSDYSILFGGPKLESRYANTENVKVFGPGNSKVFIDKDYVEDDEIYEKIEDSMIRDGGRGCINMSQIVTNGDGEKVAKKLAERVYDIAVKDIMNPEARIPAVPGYVEGKKDPKKDYKKLEEMIEHHTGESARDITSELKKGERPVSEILEEAMYMRPTVVLIDYNEQGTNHPLYTELPFQYSSVVEVNDKQIYEALTDSLTVSMFTDDDEKIENVFMDPSIEKMYIDDTTHNIDIREPHETFIADLLYEKKGYHPRARSS